MLTYVYARIRAYVHVYHARMVEVSQTLLLAALLFPDAPPDFLILPVFELN